MEVFMKKHIGMLCMAALAGSALLFGCRTASKPAADKGILVVSFGTSYNSSRSVTIGAIESTIREQFPDYRVLRAFTADTIISILKKRDNVTVDTVTQALDRAASSGIKTLIVQPTHLMNGFEYTDLAEDLKKYEKKFDRLVLSTPLLTSDDDYKQVAAIIGAKAASYDDGSTAVCFMGHGTEAESNSTYARLQTVMESEGYKNCYIGTVEAEPSVDDLLRVIKQQGRYTQVVLMPLMVVAGDHANNDMAGDEDDSWKSIFENAGFAVTCVLEGLGQNYDIQRMYAAHARSAAESLR